MPGEFASATANTGAGNAAEEGSQKDNTLGSRRRGVEKSASRKQSAPLHPGQREGVVRDVEEAVREAASQLAAVRDGPSVRAEVDKSTEATPLKKPNVTSVTGQERSARIPTGILSQTGGPLPSDVTSGHLLGDLSTDSALVSGVSLARKGDIQIFEDRGNCNEKLLVSVPGPTPWVIKREGRLRLFNNPGDRRRRVTLVCAACRLPWRPVTESRFPALLS